MVFKRRFFSFSSCIAICRIHSKARDFALSEVHTTLNVHKRFSIPGLHCSSGLNSFRVWVQSPKRYCQSWGSYSLSHSWVFTLITCMSVTEWAWVITDSKPFDWTLVLPFFFWWNIGLAATGPAGPVPTLVHSTTSFVWIGQVQNGVLYLRYRSNSKITTTEWCKTVIHENR